MADLTNFQTYILPFATLLGIVSTFPPMPQFFVDLGKNVLIQWLFTLVLIMQGGGGMNIQLSLITTAIGFLIFKALEGINLSKQACIPVPVPAEE